jgi:F0F1-type ATP synthase assembly protein I
MAIKKNNKQAQRSSSNILRELSPYLNLGIQLVLTIGVCAVLGWWLDGKLSTTPVLLIIFTFLGAIAGMYTFIRTVLRSGKKQK